MPMLRLRTCWLLTTLLVLSGGRASAQELTAFDRSRALDMLDAVHDDIAKHYFDPAIGGVDLGGVFDTARARIKRATRVEETLLAIAQATIEINDHHTLFLSPGLVVRADYGWTMAFVGDTCRVMWVKPGSDADHQGLRAGDAISQIEGIRPGRENLFYIRYMISVLLPRRALRVLSARDGQPPVALTLGAELAEQRGIYDLTRGHDDIWELIRQSQNAADSVQSSYAEFGSDALVWRYRGFGDPDAVVAGLKRARGHAALILDLRENPGGYESTLLRLLDGVYRDSTLVASLKGRDKTKPLFVKGTGDHAFPGKLIVLIDSRSASASEAFARSVQLNGRGTILGDRSAGALRTALTYPHRSGTQTMVFYATEVAVEDFVLPDGSVVEGTGVQPDEVVLPSGVDLRERRDPLLAVALARAGVVRSAEQTGRLIWER